LRSTGKKARKSTFVGVDLSFQQILQFPLGRPHTLANCQPQRFQTQFESNLRSALFDTNKRLKVVAANILIVLFQNSPLLL